VPWDDNPAQFVINAMSPAEVISITMDEEAKSMDIAVAEDNLSKAIGRGGQNVRLASILSGWELNVMSEAQATQKTEVEAQALQKLFMEHLDVDADVAAILVQEGFSSIEEIAYVPTAELLSIEEFDEATVEELRGRARDVLLTQAIASEEQVGDAEPAEDLLSMEGMDKALAFKLANHGIRTMEELAEQAVEDIKDIEGLDETRAAQLIMTARAPWFAAEQAQNK
jgi:N utilization substance protein A